MGSIISRFSRGSQGQIPPQVPGQRFSSWPNVYFSNWPTLKFSVDDSHGTIVDWIFLFRTKVNTAGIEGGFPYHQSVRGFRFCLVTNENLLTIWPNGIDASNAVKVSAILLSPEDDAKLRGQLQFQEEVMKDKSITLLLYALEKIPIHGFQLHEGRGRVLCTTPRSPFFLAYMFIGGYICPSQRI
jgi:hypothetical protein